MEEQWILVLSVFPSHSLSHTHAHSHTHILLERTTRCTHRPRPAGGALLVYRTSFSQSEVIRWHAALKSVYCLLSYLAFNSKTTSTLHRNDLPLPVRPQMDESRALVFAKTHTHAFCTPGGWGERVHTHAQTHTHMMSVCHDSGTGVLKNPARPKPLLTGSCSYWIPAEAQTAEREPAGLLGCREESELLGFRGTVLLWRKLQFCIFFSVRNGPRLFNFIDFFFYFFNEGMTIILANHSNQLRQD